MWKWFASEDVLDTLLLVIENNVHL